MTHRHRLRTPFALALAAAALLMTGCAPTVAMEPAADAVNPDCAEIIVRLPHSVADEPIRETNAQATGAWGSPATILLRCGVPPSAPTTLPCYTVNGIDWIEDDSAAPMYRFQTYGRVPATEVVIDSTKIAGATALVDLASVMTVIPQTRKCVSVQDLTVPTK